MDQDFDQGFGSANLSQPQAQRPQGRVLVFQRRSLKAEAANDQSMAHTGLFSGTTDRKAQQLISKHAPRGWRLQVGIYVAGRAGDRIIHGVILGTKWKPHRPAAFTRDTFTACWLLLDNGEKLVANELRPVEKVQTKF